MRDGGPQRPRLTEILDKLSGCRQPAANNHARTNAALPTTPRPAADRPLPAGLCANGDPLLRPHYAGGRSAARSHLRHPRRSRGFRLVRHRARADQVRRLPLRQPRLQPGRQYRTFLQSRAVDARTGRRQFLGGHYRRTAPDGPHPGRVYRFFARFFHREFPGRKGRSRTGSGRRRYPLDGDERRAVFSASRGETHV